MTELAQPIRDLLTRPNFAAVATLMPDGSPQVTTTWVDTDGDHVLINTAEGRQKSRNLRRDPRVAISVFDRDNPYHQVIIRGRVAEITTEGAEDHIHKMAKKYTGQDRYPLQPGERRLLVKIAPEHVTEMGR